MKKIIVMLFMLSLGIMFFDNGDEIIIPKNAIRFRIIANSNSVGDQKEKLIVKGEVQKEVYKLLNDVNNLGDARLTINENMDELDKIVSKYNIPYKIDYGYNYFPAKNYKGIIYEAGNYESLVITLGEGVGDNFWCVLFPPLCNLEHTKEDVEDVKYQLYVKKILDKF